MPHREPLYAYRLLYPDNPHAPEMLWEWEEPYIHCLLWNAKTFGRTVVQCLFVHGNALAAANQRIWPSENDAVIDGKVGFYSTIKQ